MPAAISKPRNKGKARADPYEKITASMPLGKQLAHTGMSTFDFVPAYAFGLIG